MNINRAFFILSIFAIGMGIITVLTVLFWLLYPYNPIVFNDSVFPILNKTVKAGGRLSYTSDYCKYTNLTAVVSRTFVNGLIFITPPSITKRPSGCHMISVEVPIPHELPPGKYHLENIYSYQVNPIRTVTVFQNTEEFEVVEASGSGVIGL